MGDGCRRDLPLECPSACEGGTPNALASPHVGLVSGSVSANQESRSLLLRLGFLPAREGPASGPLPPRSQAWVEAQRGLDRVDVGQSASAEDRSSTHSATKTTDHREAFERTVGSNMKASDWIETIKALPRIPDREDEIWKAVNNGFAILWPTKTVGSISVAFDYFSIGDPSDFVRVPVSGPLALRIADHFGARLPTKDEVDAIWRGADVKLAPLPWGPPYDESMLSVERFVEHNARIEVQRLRMGRTGLVAGHKKDILGVKNGNVVIYGWHQLDGVPIQGPVPNDHSHSADYADYSHGLRLVWD